MIDEGKKQWNLFKCKVNAATTIVAVATDFRRQP
jgi:hypothetical protein